MSLKHVSLVASMFMASVATAQEWRTGSYAGLSYSYVSSEVSWQRNSGVRTPDLEATDGNLAIHAGYDWDIGARRGAGLEISYAGTLGGATPWENCSGSGNRACSAEISRALQLSGRVLFDMSDTSALVARAGLTSARISTNRAPTGTTSGNLANERRLGGYVGVGYLMALPNGHRWSLDLTYHTFDAFDSSVQLVGRDDVNAASTVIGLRYEITF